MDGDLCPGLDVHGGECFAVELVHPGADVADPAGEDGAHGGVPRGARSPEGCSATAEGRRAVLLISLQQFGDAGACGRHQGLVGQVLLGVGSALAGDARDPVGVADPAESALDRRLPVPVAAVLVVVLAAVGLLCWGRERTDRAVGEHEGQAPDLPAHARQRPVARGGTAGDCADDVRKLDAVCG